MITSMGEFAQPQLAQEPGKHGLVLAVAMTQSGGAFARQPCPPAGRGCHGSSHGSSPTLPMLSWAAAVPASAPVADAQLPHAAVTTKRHHRHWWRVVSAGSALPPSVAWRWLIECRSIGGRLLACSDTDVVGPTGRRFGTCCVLLVAALHVPRGRNGADYAPGGTCMRHECSVRLNLQQTQWIRVPGQACTRTHSPYYQRLAARSGEARGSATWTPQQVYTGAPSPGRI